MCLLLILAGMEPHDSPPPPPKPSRKALNVLIASGSIPNLSHTHLESESIAGHFPRFPVGHGISVESSPDDTDIAPRLQRANIPEEPSGRSLVSPDATNLCHGYFPSVSGYMTVSVV